MLIPKILVIAVILLLVFTGTRRWFLFNKYVVTGLIILITLAVIFSDSLYHLFTKRVLQYVQSPQQMEMPFISEKWKDAGSQNPGDNTRQSMSTDLMIHHKLLKKSRSDVINLLGDPGSPKNFTDWDMEYYLGPSQQVGSQGSEWLVIKFDKNDLVEDYTILNQ